MGEQKKKVSRIVWFDETETGLPELHAAKDMRMETDEHNLDEVRVGCSLRKPKVNAKKIKITVEEI